MSKRPRAYAWNRNFPKFSESFVSSRTQQPHDFNQPTQAQIERCKQFPPVEIKGVVVKGSELPQDIRDIAQSLISYINEYPDESPYLWMRHAELVSEWMMDRELCKKALLEKVLLEILNNEIPTKPGMKLENFSAKEFDQKYLHSRPSLLEQWTAAHEPTINMIRASDGKNLGPLTPTAEDLIPRPVDINQVVEDPVYLSLEIEGMENTDIQELSRIFDIVAKRQATSQIKLRDESDNLYRLYTDAVENIEKTVFSSNWGIALFLQDGYWHVFRGYTISVIRLMSSIINHNKPQYDLPTPIDGMK